ncbi:MAG: alpha/beta fold hydrolase [Alphaproteobacteria bacterium]|nr:alpha/beta fold hydrolase [Alphaproteobacteria bacterium]
MNIKKYPAYVAVFVVIIFAVAFNLYNTSKEIIINGDHGKLSAVLQTPDDRAEYPLVMILHGFNSSKDMPLLKQIADKLEQSGIASIRFDFNGHGKSEGSFQNMTISNELNDAKKVYEYVKSLPKVTSVSVTGHSQGGVVAGLISGEYGAEKIKSAVLMAPASVLREMAQKGDMFGTKFDPENIPEYIELPHGLRVGRAYLEDAKTLPIYEISASYQGPVLIIHSQDDELVPYSNGEEYHQVYQKSELKTLHGFDHSFTQNTNYVAQIVADYFTKQLRRGE